MLSVRYKIIKFRALKKKERERKLNQIYETNKRQIREKYKFCNLYVKGLPDNIDEDFFRGLFEKFGKIRSCRTVRKELFQSYLGIKRSVKVSGFVCFEESRSAKDAKTDLNNTNPFPNHPKLFVDFHQTKAERNEFLKLQMINSTNKAFQVGGQGEQPFGMFKNMKGLDRKF
jgi:RNA recognition motif-containing protein